MADTADALELLIDPEHRLATEGAMARMDASTILVKLQADGTDLEAARTLVRDAVVELRGKYRSLPHTSPQLAGAGQPRIKWVDEFWVPVDKQRST